MQIPKRSPIGCLLFWLSLCLSAGTAMARELPPVVSSALARAGIPRDAVGVYVQDVAGRKPLAVSNPNLALSPASTMKLVTTNAALDLLGPTFTWKTQAYANGVLNGDVLQGDLIFKGGGDPKLVTENFWMFLRQIRAKGIREIRGNVVLDRSVFENAQYDASKFDGDAIKAYNAAPDALLINYQALRFTFMPNEASGTVAVMLDPPTGYTVTPPKLSGEECEGWQSRLGASWEPHGVSFSGTYPASCGDRIWHMHAYQQTHTQYFAAVFRRMWSDLGGGFTGEVSEGVTPAAARLVAQWESVTLPEVIRDINKYSNNVMARQLLLTLAANALKRPGTPERGALVIRGWLEEKGIAAPELVVENGSGLSRTERISAQTMGRMLVAAYRSPVMPELMSSLPLVGYDGTMRNRLKDRSIAGNAHIKTGRLDDVRAVAGYVLAASGKRYAVVCLINHRNAARGLEAQDALLQWVYEHG